MPSAPLGITSLSHKLASAESQPRLRAQTEPPPQDIVAARKANKGPKDIRQQAQKFRAIFLSLSRFRFTYSAPMSLSSVLPEILVGCHQVVVLAPGNKRHDS